MCCSEAICCGESDADPLQSRPIYLALWGDLGHTGTILGRVDNGGSPQGRTSLDSSNSTHSIEPEDYMDEEAEVEDPQPDSGRRSHNRLSTPKPGPSAPSDDTTKTSSSPTTGRKKSVFGRIKKRFRTRPIMVPALETKITYPLLFIGYAPVNVGDQAQINTGAKPTRSLAQRPATDSQLQIPQATNPVPRLGQWPKALQNKPLKFQQVSSAPVCDPVQNSAVRPGPAQVMVDYNRIVGQSPEMRIME
jgi:hypothetical protein